MSHLHVLFTILRDPELFGLSDAVDIIGTTRRGEEHAIKLAQAYARKTDATIIIAKAQELDDSLVESAKTNHIIGVILKSLWDLNADEFVSEPFGEEYSDAAVIAALGVVWTTATTPYTPKVSTLHQIAGAVQQGMDSVTSQHRIRALALSELIRRLLDTDDEDDEMFDNLMDEIGQIAQSCLPL